MKEWIFELPNHTAGTDNSRIFPFNILIINSVSLSVNQTTGKSIFIHL